jgi:O-antigen ligase
MWVFPFLYPRHNYPLTTFYQEWWSVLLGVLAMSALVVSEYWQAWSVPRIAQLPTVLMLVVALQWLLGKIAYADQAVLYGLYLLFAALLMLLGARLRDVLGLVRVSIVLAVALLIGAELSALIGVLQHFAWHTPFDPIIVAKISAAVYGNLAQPNHFAAYIALGLMSLGLLLQQDKLGKVAVALLSLPLLFVMAMSASRSSWLYLLLMLVLAWHWSRRDVAMRPVLRYTLLLLAGFGLMHLFAHMQVMDTQTHAVNTVQRLMAGNETGDIRLYLWHEAGLMLWQSPLLGVGFGQFAWQHFQLVPQLHPGNITGLYNNAHNLVMQLAAETGVAGLAILFFALTVWLNSVRRVAHDVTHWWGYAALGVLAIHSLLEYPLWYAYFIAVAAVLLGVFDETRYDLRLRLFGQAAMIAMLLLSLVVLAQLMVGYRKLERGVAGTDVTATLTTQEWLQLRRAPMLAPYVDMALSGRIGVNENYLEQKLALNTRLTHYAPIGVVVYRQALLLAQHGDLQQARTIWHQARWSYPEDFETYLRQLAVLAEKDPAHFAALLEFALQKEQESVRAIH